MSDGPSRLLAEAGLLSEQLDAYRSRCAQLMKELRDIARQLNRWGFHATVEVRNANWSLAWQVVDEETGVGGLVLHQLREIEVSRYPEHLGTTRWLASPAMEVIRPDTVACSQNVVHIARLLPELLAAITDCVQGSARDLERLQQRENDPEEGK